MNNESHPIEKFRNSQIKASQTTHIAISNLLKTPHIEQSTVLHPPSRKLNESPNFSAANKRHDPSFEDAPRDILI